MSVSDNNDIILMTKMMLSSTLKKKTLNNNLLKHLYFSSKTPPSAQTPNNQNVQLPTNDFGVPLISENLRQKIFPDKKIKRSTSAIEKVNLKF